MRSEQQTTATRPTKRPSQVEITQTMLVAVQEARRRAEKVCRRFMRMEQKVIRLVKAETPVEPGILSARVQGHCSYDLNEADLRAYLGQMAYSLFVASLPLKTHYELLIEEKRNDIAVVGE